jgi:hypothetical protein
VPPGHRPRRNTAYSRILSFQHEVTRRDGSKYARGSTRAICAGKGVRWTLALRLPSAQATGQAVRADRTRANLYDLRNTSPTPDSPTSTKASSALHLGPARLPPGDHGTPPAHTTMRHSPASLIRYGMYGGRNWRFDGVAANGRGRITWLPCGVGCRTAGAEASGHWGHVNANPAAQPVLPAS